MGHHIVMGRKTYESIDRLLPGRTTVIVTRQRDYAVPGAIVAHSVEEALDACKGDDEIFVIGGADLFRETLPIADRLYLTVVDAEPDGRHVHAGVRHERVAGDVVADLSRRREARPRLSLRRLRSAAAKRADVPGRIIASAVVPATRIKEAALSQRKPLKGMLQLDELREARRRRRDRDRRRRLHRSLRPAPRQALRRRDVRRGHRRGRRARLRLPAHGRHGDGARPGLPLRELGARLRRLPPRARFQTLRIASWLEKSAFVLCDLKNEKTHEYVARRAAIDPAPPARRRESARLRRLSPHPSSSTTSSARATAKRTSRTIAISNPGGWYLEDYHILQGTRTEDFHARRAPAPEALGRAGRELQRRMGTRASTKSTCATPKRSRWPTATSSSSSA